MLYMLEIIQLVRYCRSYWKRDKWHLKLVVILCFIIDTICTIAICAWVFMVRASPNVLFVLPYNIGD